MGRFPRLLAWLAALLLIAGGGASASASVAPIVWQPGTAPTDTATVRVHGVLLNADRYLLKTWYPQTFGAQTGPVLDFGGIGIEHIRPSSSASLALAITLRTGAFDPARVGVSQTAARDIAVRLASSLAKRHLATQSQGWGDDWQTAYLASAAGLAGWLLWDHLDGATRLAMERMIEHEADRFLSYTVPYYRNRAGTIVFKGDTKAEENAWNANILQLATAMMPQHPHHGAWMYKNIELMLSAFSRPSDVNSESVWHGRALKAWLNGSNIEPSGHVVNHDRIHPDYQTTIGLNLNSMLPYSLAGLPTPYAALLNAGIVYRALTDYAFPSPPFQAPGGSIYMANSDRIYYPHGADWGLFRRIEFAGLDTQAALFNLDKYSTVKAPRWEELHMQAQVAMQNRFTDGRTYGAWEEFRYAEREQLVSLAAAQAYLTRRLAATRAVRFSNASVPGPAGSAASRAVGDHRGDRKR